MSFSLFILLSLSHSFKSSISATGCSHPSRSQSILKMSMSFWFELENVVVSTYGLNQYGKQTLNWITVQHSLFAYRLRISSLAWIHCDSGFWAKYQIRIFRRGRTSFNVNRFRYICLCTFKFLDLFANAKVENAHLNHQQLYLPRPRFMQIQTNSICYRQYRLDSDAAGGGGF